MTDTVAMSDATEVVHSTDHMSLDTPANLSDDEIAIADAAIAAAAAVAAKRAAIVAKVAAARLEQAQQGLEQAQQVEAAKGSAKKAKPEDFFAACAAGPAISHDKTSNYNTDSIKNERMQGVFGAKMRIKP
jgi:hypothetical protein